VPVISMIYAYRGALGFAYLVELIGLHKKALF
jgi:hypothetical protein